MEKNFTVNVAKSRLSVGYTNNDQSLLDLWNQLNVFEKTNQSFNQDQKPFVLLDGPPYANGNAHMGHGLNKLLKNLVVKSRWAMGQPVQYQPGWDCHGLPLELAVEKKYGKLPTETLKSRCKSLAFRSLVKQRKSFKRLGVLGDWDNPYVTLSKSMLEQSWRTLSTLVDKQLLEYKQFPVHYCPACASSLAEAELENKVLTKDSLYFKMLLNQNHSLPSYCLVWTTTPWTLPMNQGLVYRTDFTYEVWSNNKELLYLQNSSEKDVQQWLLDNGYQFKNEVAGDVFNNQTAYSPLTKKLVPLLHADFVEEGKTGFVHMACAHGPEDYELGQTYGVVPHTYLNKYGVFDTENDSVLSSLHAKKYTQVATLVTELLKGDLVFYSHDQVEQQVCWRHQCGVYYNATWQVFLQLELPSYNLKEKVKNVLNDSELSPHYKERLEQMLLNRKNWCLSRQRQWGCPMNLLVNKKDNLLSPLSSVYLSFLANNKQAEASLLLNDNPDLMLFTDVVDVWFDSGNVVNEYVHQHGQNNNHYAVDLVLEGKDQFRGWFQSLLWLSVANNNLMPYRNLLGHGFVLNEKREKFSKSTGNGKVVEYYADLYGSDVLQLWAANQEPETDAVFSESKLEEMKRYYSRLRLSLRFLTSNLYDYDYSQHENNLNLYQNHSSFDLHRYVLKELAQLFKDSCVYFQQYQFKKAVDSLYSLCDKTLSNFYFETVKNNLYLNKTTSEARLLAQTGLYEVLLSLFDLVKVYCPFVSEEFFQDFYGNKNESVLCQHHLLNNCESYLNNTVEFDWNQMNEYRKNVQSALEPYQKNKTLKSRTEAQVNFSVNKKSYHLLEGVSQFYNLGDVFGVSHVYYNLDSVESVSVVDLKTDNHYMKCPRCWTYQLSVNFNNELCECCQKQQ